MINIDEQSAEILGSHLESNGESCAMITSAYVIKKGIPICGQKDHKGNGYPSITYAAPVILNGKKAYVAVSVLHGDKHRAHGVCVLDGNGKRFTLDNKKIDVTPTSEGAKAITAVVAQHIGVTSNEMLSQQKRIVNREIKKERGANFNQDFTKAVADRLAVALNPYRLAMNAQIDRWGVQRMEERIVDELLSDDEFRCSRLF